MNVAILTKRRKMEFIHFSITVLCLTVLIVGWSSWALAATSDVTGCATTQTADYSSGFDASNFVLTNTDVSGNKTFVLNTGKQALDFNKIVVPFDQEVSVTFIFEGAGHTKGDFGWLLAKDAKFKSDGTLDINAMKAKYCTYSTWKSAGGCPSDTIMHEVYYDVNDNNDDGVIDMGESNTTPRFGDANGDGKIDLMDNTLSLGTFAGGTELVFFLKSDNQSGKVFFTKTAWNPDTYSGSCTKTFTVYKITNSVITTLNGSPNNVPTSVTNKLTPIKDKVFYYEGGSGPASEDFATAVKALITSSEATTYYSKIKSASASSVTVGTGDTFYKTFQLWVSNEGCKIPVGGWMSSNAITRLKNFFNLEMKTGDTYTFPITIGKQFPHVMIGANNEKPFEWILGWEDLLGGGDTDFNDLSFRINRQTGGTAKLKSSVALDGADHSIYAYPAGTSDAEKNDYYYTAVTIEVKDNIPCPGKTNIKYKISIDGGTSWFEVTEWENIKEMNSSGSILGDVTTWRPGVPQYTYRTGRIDFAGKGIAGNQLVWKAELISDDASCEPEIIMVKLAGAVAKHAFFSRASPVVETNVIFSGSYETPAATWKDKTLRGHLTATRIYDPKDINKTATLKLWDAGEVMNTLNVDARTIYFPDITIYEVKDEVIGTGDGATKTFYGKLAKAPIQGGTVTIKAEADNEIFKDVRTDDLEGSKGGTGTLKRFTGAYIIEFKTAPGNNIPIKASYKYYVSSENLKAFTTTNINNEMLSIDSTYLIGKGYVYDLNNDNAVTEADGDTVVRWVRGEKFTKSATQGAGGTWAKKEWLLGAIDHSVPAVLIPPGLPPWYYGSQIDDDKRKAYDEFREKNKERQTVVFIGSRDGMIHAFDGGKFRWGDNPDTDYKEIRGYFKWESGVPNYGTGQELWAFIPINLLARFKNNFMMGDDQAYVDASPAIADVYINGAWKSVLLAAEGNGGDTVVCLDVTAPASPKFLWEFQDPDLFRSISSPAVASIGRIYDIYDGSEKWAAFFVSGKSYNPSLPPSIYIIDIATGAVVKRVFLDAVSDGYGGTPSGQPATIDSDGNGYVDRIYIGTDKGYMYKVNVPDEESTSSPTSRNLGFTNCVINPDMSPRHPIYASPAVVSTPKIDTDGTVKYEVRVFFGTGDSPYYAETLSGTQTYHFYAYKDTNTKSQCTGATQDWSFELESGHRIWASAFAAAGQVYFGTSTSNTEDPCEGYTADGSSPNNKGKMYSFSIEGGVKKWEQQVGDVIASPVVDDQHLYYKTSMKAAPMSFGSGHYNNSVQLGGVIDTGVISWREVE